MVEGSAECAPEVRLLIANSPRTLRRPLDGGANPTLVHRQGLVNLEKPGPNPAAGPGRRVHTSTRMRRHRSPVAGFRKAGNSFGSFFLAGQEKVSDG
jgi:hypothetical protein